MPGTGINILLIDVVIKPFAKIIEKMPGLTIFLLMLLYSTIAYIVIKSAYMSDNP